MRFALLFLLLAAPALAGEGGAWLKTMQEARAAAQAGDRPILLDFQAVWCYSCYYMHDHVLSRARFREAARELVLLKLDVDRPEGRKLRKRYQASFLPSYVLVDAAGEEIGRIIGEQTEDDFLEQLDFLKSRRPSGALAGLRKLYEMGRFAEAVRVRAAELKKDPGLAKDERWRRLSARLDLRRAKKAKDGAAATAALERVLELPADCALPYDFWRAKALWDGKNKKRRTRLLADLRTALEKLAERGVFGAKQARCADLRSAVSALGDVYEDLGLKSERSALFEKTIALLKGSSKKLGTDRNQDDNLRYFLELAGRQAELDGLYPKLMEAYPADYVYAYRYAQNLVRRKKARAALFWVEKAYLLSYGVNRLTVAGARARILVSLDRAAEARKLLERDIRANRKRFPEAVSALEKQAQELGG